jgi:cold shock CspA family protein
VNTSPHRPTITSGVVAEFDRDVGLGTVRAGDGIEIGFHCTQIADGSRDIAVGVAVEFVVLAGRHGRWEAGSLRPPLGAAQPGALRGAPCTQGWPVR